MLFTANRTMGVLLAVLVVGLGLNLSTAHAGDLKQALTWLQSQQRADGAWCDSSYQPSAISSQPVCVAETAEVLKAVADQPRGVSADAVMKGVAFVSKVEVYDSGLLARKLLIAHRFGGEKGVVEKDVEKLRSLVREEGGIAVSTFYMPASPNSSITALPFLVRYDPALAARVARYVASTQNTDGSFSPAHDVATTAEAVMALTLAQGYVDVSDAIVAGLKFIVSQVNPDGSMGSCPAGWPEGTYEADCTRDTAWGVLAVQTIAGDINNIVPNGVAYLTSQLDAESSLRQDAVLTALYVRVAGNEVRRIGANAEKGRTEVARRLPGAEVSTRDGGDAISPKDSDKTPKRKPPRLPDGAVSRTPNRLPRLPSVADLVGVSDGLCTVQDVKPEFGPDFSNTNVSAFLDGVPYQIGAPITEEGEHVIQFAGTNDFIRFRIDRTAPVVELHGVTDGEHAKTSVSPTVDVRDHNLDGTHLTLNGLPYESGTPITEAGSYTLAVTAWDCAGNVETKSASFTVVPH